MMLYGIGALCIVMGFFLFINFSGVPGNTAGTVWAGNQLILLLVVPGSFFVFVGVLIIGYLIITQPGEYVVRKSESHVAGHYQNGSGKRADLESLRKLYLKDFQIFSEVFQKLDQNESVPEKLKTDFENAIQSIKHYLMYSVWDESWGKYPRFRRWLLKGRTEPVPHDIARGVKFFSGRS